MYVVITHRVLEDPLVHGPFDDESSADAYAKRLGFMAWAVVPVRKFDSRHEYDASFHA